MDLVRAAVDYSLPSRDGESDDELIIVDDSEPEQEEVVHKLQKAVKYASRQKLDQDAQGQGPSQASSAERSIIQMAPPAPGPSRTTSKPGQKLPGPKLPAPRGKPEKVPKRHHCSVTGCVYSTPKTKDLVRHMRKHTGEKPFNCDRCTKSFTRYDKLVTHIRIHEGHRPFTCHVCNHASTDSSSLKKHMRTHTDQRPYKCDMCQYSSRDPSQLAVHKRSHTGDSPYVCTFNYCEAAFKTSSDLSRHTRLHTGEKPYKCLYCDYRAAVKCNLNAHMKGHTNPGKAQARGKPKTVLPVVIDPQAEFHETDSLGEASKLPFQYACKFCAFKADTIEVFQVHFKSAHPEIQQKSPKKPTNLTVPQKKPFPCTKCSAGFVTEDSLKCHMKQHAMVPNKPADVSPELYQMTTKMRVFRQARLIRENASAQPSSTNIPTIPNNIIESPPAPPPPPVSDNQSSYTLHELQTVVQPLSLQQPQLPPLPMIQPASLFQSVITENPTMASNGYHPPPVIAQPFRQMDYQPFPDYQTEYAYVPNYDPATYNHLAREYNFNAQQ